jgi:hypothetical protein
VSICRLGLHVTEVPVVPQKGGSGQLVMGIIGHTVFTNSWDQLGMADVQVINILSRSSTWTSFVMEVPRDGAWYNVRECERTLLGMQR